MADAAGKAVERARKLAAELSEELGDLELRHFDADDRVERCVARLAKPDIPFGELARLADEPDSFLAALGLSAIARRDDVPRGWTKNALEMLRSCDYELEPFVFRALATTVSEPMVGRVLNLLEDGPNWLFLARFVEARRELGEPIDAATFGAVPATLAPTLERFIDRYERYLGEDFRACFDDWQHEALDSDFLTGLGTLWPRPYDSPPAFMTERRQEVVERILDSLMQRPRRSVLLVGEPGVGKTALARSALERLPGSPAVFEAGAAAVYAGAVYVGELETHVKELAEKLKGQAVVWLFPAFEEALYAGQHSRSPKGMLDSLLPYIEAGELTLVAEIDPGSLESLLAQRPRAAGAFDVVQVRPLDEAESVGCVRHALEHDDLDVEASDRALSESYELAQQFLPTLAAPGNVLKLSAFTAAEAAERGERQFDTADVLAALATSSGLPLAMLDPRERLDLGQARAFFEARVLGQPEAVECLLERIAIVKAGLTDPTRPLGVFLFVGPTGTGKTEIAKALAEFMFGSAQRMVRLDMSEFQTPDSFNRLLASPSPDRPGSVLITSVRKEPFAVVLLDEFEKASEQIWDLFLQVFDDGRLTDQHGRLVDFRRCIIILTSNVGSALAHRPGVGFGEQHGRFRRELIEAELRRSFRPEFLNRIDRIVVFNPFERAQMRALLDKELREVIERRGLRGRPWAVELDESAYEFIIEQGFSPELGARPLKRAVERHLLAPIAAAIVEQAVPEGDQFLLVSAPGGRRIEVTFVDPDAPAAGERDADAVSREGLDLRTLALRESSDQRSARFVLEELLRLRSAIEGDLLGQKETALAAMHEDGFWEDEARFGVLAEVEYLDRLEAALATARKLGERLDRRMDSNGAGAGELVQLLSVRLHVLDAAVSGIAEHDPREVFLQIQPGGDAELQDGAAWAETLAGMYATWADRRGMRVARLTPAEHLYVVDGLGAGHLLRAEAGIHVLELVDPAGDGEQPTQRVNAIVQVAAARMPTPTDRAALVLQARAALAEAEAGRAVVRRYRGGPAPLVRDAVRGYRTGRLDRVLAGDFDLF